MRQLAHTTNSEGIVMAKAMPSASDVAQRWQTGFGGAGPKWAAGIQAVDTAPGILAAAAKDRYLQGTQAAGDKFATNVAKVDLGTWKTQSVNKGQARLASGAQAGAQKYQAKIAPVLQAIGQIRDSLPARGDIMTNLERARQMALGLNQRAQQGW